MSEPAPKARKSGAELNTEEASDEEDAYCTNDELEDADEDSDFEVEGIDMEDEELEDEDEDEADGTEIASEENDEEEEDFAKTEEMRDYAEAKKERLELMAVAQKKRDEGAAMTNEEHRLQYLLSQSEVFAHFLAGSVAADNKKKKGGRPAAGGRKHRLSEAEEDSRLLKTAASTRKTVRLDKQPGILHQNCKMHVYQLEGLNWMIKLHDHGINGILADEMGLGKTLQCISLIGYLRESRGIRGPHLVIVPKSVVGNWVREFRKWCPQIRVLKLLAKKLERRRVMKEELPPDDRGRRKWDVLVTSYEGILKELNELRKIDWEYVFIDEAHRIKNEKSSLSKAVRKIDSRFRILITGTPLQNNLHELWALLNFLLPDIFGDADQFDKWFSLSSADAQDNVIRKLHTVLRPFMLRRTKKDVAMALPPKKETKLFIGLTPMQQDWYTRVLRKDAHELNALGGPDRVRLLNILMQLRKVCNHPYLFDGAELGPPYSDGPHLWEASGKMMLLHKLLPKLKEKGSRVLIFSQMTRLLDIMEDYLRFIGYKYCRIDGDTEGERRDAQIQDFNSEGSDKFVFLLSTRAGGLGINLATADIVILYDSDWNPQVDLQAMDRAHRIGQTKTVQVFRFITEGSVEEKIIERADRKLFLDAAVIQQGRLAEKFGAVGKDELMKMVRFGADQILNCKGGTYTEEDIDALIAKGEEKTKNIQAKLKTDAKHNLASFSLLGDESGKDMHVFAGKDFRDETKDSGNFINLPQRERKRNYDVDGYYREAMSSGSKPSSDAHKKRKKGPTMHDYQLFDRERIEQLYEKERILEMKREQHLNIIKELRSRVKHAPSMHGTRGSAGARGESKEELMEQIVYLEEQVADFELPPDERIERDTLVSQGFPDWTKKDFKGFINALERHGRYDITRIVQDVSKETFKDEGEVKRYYISFWTNYRRISDWKKVLDKIERGEKKILRLKEIRESIQEKVERHCLKTFGHVPGEGDTSSDEMLHHAWQSMSINYPPGHSKSRTYTEEEDAFLLCMMHKHGYGAYERIKLEIRRAWQFRMDWYFKSKSGTEIQKRCDALVKIVERENEEVHKKEQMQAQRNVPQDVPRIMQRNGPQGVPGIAKRNAPQGAPPGIVHRNAQPIAPQPMQAQRNVMQGPPQPMQTKVTQ